MDKYFSNMNSEKRLYTLQALPIHLINARQTERLQRLLTDFLFIEAKIDALGPASLIIDFDLILTWDLSIPKESIEILKILRNVIQLSTHILIQDKTQLVGQLIGHLISQKFPAIQALLENAVRSTTGSWLCPLAPSLIPPDSLLRQTLIGHEDYIHAVAITPDGRYGISVEMKKLIMWNIEHGVLLHTFASNVDNDEFSEGFEEVMVTAGGQHAIVIDGSLVKLLNIEHGKELHTWKSHAYLHSIGVTYNGQEIYAYSTSKFIIWKLGQEGEIYTQDIDNLPGTNISIYQYHESYRAINALWSGDLIVIDIMSRKILFTLKGHIDSITSIAVSSNGKIAISASVDCTLKVWNLQQGILLHNLEGHNRTIESVAMTPDGRRGVSASADGTLKVWDLERGIELSTLRGHGRAVSSVAITPDGRRAISGAIDGVVKIWDLETVENLSVLSQDKFYDSHHKNAVSSLVVTPDRELAISVSVDETMTIWLLEKAVPILTYQCPCDGLPIDRGLLRSLHAALVSPIPHHGLTSVAITPDMRYIVAASADKRLKVIELSHRLDFVDLITKSISTKWHFLTGHQDLVWTVAVTPDGRRAISGSDDRTIKIWDLKQCKELYTLEGHSDRIIAIVVTPDGRYMISATTSRVYTWNLRSKRIVSTFNIKDNEEVITVVTTTTKGPYVISQTTGHSLNVWHLESQNHVCTLSHLHRINGSALLDTAEYLISVSDDGI